jgi:hypothetical protein
MNIDLLLQQLNKINIYLEEDRRRQDGTRVLIFRSNLPNFPFGNQQSWHTLVLEPGQVIVDRQEIESILRHFWQLSSSIFPDDDANETGHPVDLIDAGSEPDDPSALKDKIN